MTDIASLNIKIDTSDAKTAKNDLDKMTSAGKIAASQMGSMSNAAVKLGKALAAAFVSYKIAQFTQDVVMAAARYETLGVVMLKVGSNAGYTASQVTSFSNKIRESGIQMDTARQVTIRMIQAQIDMSQASKLARIAQDAAVIGQINSSEALERMIHGIQSAETEIMKGIGLNVSFEKAYKTLAKQLGVNKDSLTEQQKMQARVNETMEVAKAIAGSYEASMTTAGKQIDSFTRYIGDFKVEMGQAFNPSTGKVVAELTDLMKELSKTISSEEAQDGLEDIAVALADMTISAASFIKEGLPGHISTLGTAVSTVVSIYNSIPSELTGPAGAGIVGAVLFGGQIGKIVATIVAVNNGMSAMGNGLGDLVAKHKASGEAIMKLWNSITDAVSGSASKSTVISKDFSAVFAEHFKKAETATTAIVTASTAANTAAKKKGLTDQEKALKKSLEEQKRALEAFNDDYKKATLSTFDYEVDKLDEAYKEREKLVKAGLITEWQLQEWYADRYDTLYQADVENYYDAQEQKIAAQKKIQEEQLKLEQEAADEAKRISDEAAEAQQDAYDELYDGIYGFTRNVIDDWDDMGNTLVHMAEDMVKDIAAAFLTQSIVMPVYMYAANELGLSSLVSGSSGSSVTGASAGTAVSGAYNAYSAYGSLTGGTADTIAKVLGSEIGSSIGEYIFGAEAWGGYNTIGTGATMMTDSGAMLSVNAGGAGTTYSTGMVNSLSNAGAAGIISNLAYTYLGEMLGLPQGEYSGLGAGVGGAAGYTVGASLASGAASGATSGSWAGPVGAIVGAIVGGVGAALLGEDEPDYRIGLFPGNFDWEGSDRVATSENYRYSIATQDYSVKNVESLFSFYDDVFQALDEATTASINDIVAGAQTGDYGRISWFDPSDMSTEDILERMTTDLFRSIRKGLVEDIGAGFDADVFTFDFFESIQQEGENLLDTYLGFREAAEKLGTAEFLDQFNYQIDTLNVSAAQAYENMKVIAETVYSMTETANALSSTANMTTFEETVNSWQVLIETLERVKATSEQLTEAELARNEVLGSQVTGLTATTIESQILNGGDLNDLVSTQITAIATSSIAETIYAEYIESLNEEAGRVFAESDYDINVLIEYLQGIDTTEAQKAIAELMESFGLLSDTAEDQANDIAEYNELLAAAAAKRRELSIDILYAQGEAEQALAMEREDIINELIETYGSESDTIIDLQKQLWALNDAAEATTEVLEDLLSVVEDARNDYENALNTALSAAKSEYDALVESFKSAEDQLNTVRAAHIEEQKTLLQAQTDAYSDSIADLTDELSELESIAANLKEYREGLLLGDDSPLLPGEMLAEAKAQFAAAGPEGIVDASQNLLSAGKGALTDYKEYAKLFSMVQSRVSGAESDVKTQSQALQEQIDMASVQVDLLNAEIELMSETSETLMSMEQAEAEYYAAKLELDNSSFAEDIAFYEKELDRLDRINGSVMSLDQATKNYQSALIAAISQGYNNLAYNFQAELKELKDTLGIGASFADGGIISGPSSGYNVVTQFHGTEMIIPESKFDSIKSDNESDEEIKSLLRTLISKVSEDSQHNKKIHRILDRADAGQGSLLVRTT